MYIKTKYETTNNEFKYCQALYLISRCRSNNFIIFKQIIISYGSFIASRCHTKMFHTRRMFRQKSYCDMKEIQTLFQFDFFLLGATFLLLFALFFLYVLKFYFVVFIFYLVFIYFSYTCLISAVFTSFSCSFRFLISFHNHKYEFLQLVKE